jgi:uncharacterized protein (TIGR03084 family)
MNADPTPRLPEAEDFRAECQAIYELLRDAPERVWDEPTGFKGWTAIDVLAHLHKFNEAAAVTLEGDGAFAKFTAGYKQAIAGGMTGAEYTRIWAEVRSGPELLERWRAYADVLADLYRDVDPRRRVPWANGPGMSARSCISARQMEAWAHAQAIFDVMGVERVDTDRLRNIAVIGVNTFGWTFVNRGLEPPADKPFINLAAPSGAVWSWNDSASPSSITGPATEFCQVVAQTRNVLDTSLSVQGEAARAWMSIAQCFAGVPSDPPPPGARRRRQV